MLEHAHDAGDEPTIDEIQACFPRYSHVTNMGKLLVTFLVNDEAIPIKIERIPSHLKSRYIFKICKGPI